MPPASRPTRARSRRTTGSRRRSSRHEGGAGGAEAIDAAERALAPRRARAAAARSKSAAADAAARNAIEELLVQLLSGVPCAAGVAAPRIDKAASIMQQILRRKGGDDGAHEMLAMNGEATRLDVLERKEREQPAPSAATDEGAAVVEDGGSDGGDDDKMVTKAAAQGDQAGANKLTKPKGKVSKRAVLEAAGALAPATGAKRGGAASSSLKAFRKLRADPEAVERGCLLRPADDKTPGAASAWVDLANLFGEALTEDDVSAVVCVAQRRCKLDDANGAFALLAALSAVPRFRLVIGFLGANDRSTLGSVWAHLGAHPLCASSVDALMTLAREYACEESCEVPMGDGLD